jgi:hypothetical protein
MPAIMSGTPAVTLTSPPTAANTDSGSPASVDTLARRLSSKSSSPFMARKVMRSTSGSEPASAARSSITSFSMSVESTSSTTRKPAMGLPSVQELGWVFGGATG